MTSLQSLEQVYDNNLHFDETPSDAHHYEVNYSETFNASEVPYSVQNINFYYEVADNEFGAFGFSTMIPEEDVPDTNPNGFFTYIIEPNPTEAAAVLPKAFTLIIDKSGSMYGNKIVQAKQAASYIVNNLNEDDLFNIVTFSSYSVSYSDQLTTVSPENTNEALEFINSINAQGSTNISGSFSTTLDIYENTTATQECVNIIIFLTDGQATSGITNDDQLVSYITNLVEQSSENFSIYPIGIGYDNFSRRLLSLIASENHGSSLFIEDNDLEVDLTQFYNTIKNPVVIDPELTFSNNSGVSEVYPQVLQNLYKGNQLIISGRYSNPSDVTLNLSGTANYEEVNYSYPLELASFEDIDKAFLTKIWAKQKIEHLLVEYYNNEGTGYAEEVREDIIELSMTFGVISPFTEFTGGDVPIEEEEIEGNNVASAPIQIIGNYPNPFNPETTISFQVNNNLKGNVKVKIFNLKGQVVKVLGVHVDGKGNYSVVWNGLDSSGKECASGVYFYTVDWGQGCLSSKMILVK